MLKTKHNIKKTRKQNIKSITNKDYSKKATYLKNLIQSINKEL